MTRDNSTHPTHYHGEVEPIDLIIAQKLDFPSGSVVKYVCRANKSGEKLADLKKAQWYIWKLIEIAEKEAEAPIASSDVVGDIRVTFVQDMNLGKNEDA